ncbi:response regulator [Pendulispora albinea]|uniref:Response regulator n=1 Tax=Pendulispora albinea TaxID=2741071 RepID=A0ABZ2LQ54_9BACT
MNLRSDPKTREARAASVDLHALVREVLIAKRAVILAAGQHVTLELNARRSLVKGEREAVRELVAHGLESVMVAAVRGDKILVTSALGEDRVKLRMTCHERVFETEFASAGHLERPVSTGTMGVPAVAPSAPVLAGTRTVLVVDDDLDTVSLLRRVLERRGYEVLGATSLAEALLIARKQPFDVLISDVGLPDGSGVELMERLGRPRHAIALTGVSSEEDTARIRAAGFRQHLTKPVSLSTLEASISELLKSA